MDVRAGKERKLSAEELMLFYCGVGEDSCHVLAIINSAAMNIGVHVSLSILVCGF